MNVLEFYKPEHVQINEPLELDDDNYFCKISYNKGPFIIKTNKVCYYKQKNTSTQIYISITSKEYLEWFEKFYHDCIEKFHAISTDWFEEEMSLSEIECSFINPLKTNIRDNCFDVICTMDDNRLMVTDTNDNHHAIHSLTNHEVIPSFHIKGIKFNSKHFSLDIEIQHMYLLLNTEETSKEPERIQSIPVEVPLVAPVAPVAPVEEPEVIQIENFQEPKPIEDPVSEPTDELSEYVMNTDDLTEAEVHLDNLNIYKVYEFLNTKIKESLIEEIRTIFTSRKIKSRIDFSEVIDDEEPDE